MSLGPSLYLLSMAGFTSWFLGMKHKWEKGNGKVAKQKVTNAIINRKS